MKCIRMATLKLTRRLHESWEFRDLLGDCQLYGVCLAVTLFSRLISILGMFVNSNFVTVTARV
jgi:hypothetical protein